MYGHGYDTMCRYLHEITSRVVADSGIASDKYHIGKILLRSLQDAPHYILQIDGATDKRDTFKSALERSVRCAAGLSNIGVKYQDVIVVMAPNHIDLCIPFYASFYLGITVSGMDMNLGVNELRDSLKITAPKVIFCENSNVKTVQKALNLLNMSSQVITFGEKNEHIMSFTEFLEKHADDLNIDKFKPAEFDPEVTKGLLTSTSGTTGLPKYAALTHANIIHGFPTFIVCNTKFPSPFDMTLVVSPIQWISALLQIVLSPILRYTRIQTSSLVTPDHVFTLINKYKPEHTIMSPTFLTTLFKSNEINKCNFNSFKYILIGGSAVSKEVLNKVKNLTPNACTQIGYGLTEASALVANSVYSPPGSIGVPLKCFEVKIVDLTTNKDISEPNVPGELRLKGRSVIKEYYNNPEMTAAAFDEDGWLKTGDILYRDEYFNYYFVDRLKSLLKYRSHQVSPVEIERIIIKYPGVLDVAVTGIPDEECGELPVAFVIPLDGHNITAQEIKDLVEGLVHSSK
ncbi:unnamed protein product [Euphydryas editha]|uniref:Uncharacterized protein n=1 Tax=Euphydryas editha TaxID=104508 RepID=A0AAU9U6X2_EUPED|nr:unnamed protein product [Euphydryas editha]